MGRIVQGASCPDTLNTYFVLPQNIFQRISRGLFEASEETVWYVVYYNLIFFQLIMSALFLCDP